MNKKIDITGDRYGRLFVIKEVEPNGYLRRWLCQCDCGNQKIVAMNQLRTGKTRSCGCLNRKITSTKNSVDLTGQRFGKLTVVKRSSKKNGRVVWLCQCDCGKTVNVVSSYLTNGDTVSCGCRHAEIGEELQKYNINNLTKDGVFTPVLKSKIRADNTTGVKGVTYNRRTKKYRAQIKVKGKRYYLGEYPTLEEARKAREEGEKRYHLPFLES